MCRNAPQASLATRGELLWDEPEPGSELPAAAELVRIGHAGNECRGADLS